MKLLLPPNPLLCNCSIGALKNKGKTEKRRLLQKLCHWDCKLSETHCSHIFPPCTPFQAPTNTFTMQLLFWSLEEQRENANMQTATANCERRTCFHIFFPTRLLHFLK